MTRDQEIMDLLEEYADVFQTNYRTSLQCSLSTRTARNRRAKETAQGVAAKRLYTI